jgi:cell wall-associated NlpC family hydrolase
LACALSAAAAAVLPAITVPASAASTRLVGNIDYAYQSSPNRLTVKGWALDRAHPTRSLAVTLRLDGTARRTVTTTVYRKAINAKYRVSGRHGFRVTLSFHGGRKSGSFLGMRAATGDYLGGAPITTLGTRILATARRYLGAPYKTGGASPSGFDCSGYTEYVYRATRAGALVHNADGQRRQIQAISGGDLRPGDLIFYLDGGYAYHVAIYAGGGTGLYKGWEYAAATPKDGVLREHIWSRSLRFGTTWH